MLRYLVQLALAIPVPLLLDTWQYRMEKGRRFFYSRISLDIPDLHQIPDWMGQLGVPLVPEPCIPYK
jgi:hypothetical protein